MYKVPLANVFQIVDKFYIPHTIILRGPHSIGIGITSHHVIGIGDAKTFCLVLSLRSIDGALLSTVDEAKMNKK